ncbi:MAG: TIGR04282 family arsenosugar biosynthesis glycosyltransferase [Actinomycetota bacterium]|nr:TIGR04282 family arsenosugar biosynthesis glycosyltransferase [Actinomycetota bacterium]
MHDIALLVIAKDPLPGRAKTRLCPPCTAEQAAGLARAALLDTLEVVQHTPASRRVLVLDGDARKWRHRGIEVIPQRGTGLAERLAGAFEDVGAPALLVGMDTPQLTAALLLEGIEALADPAADAVLGPADDGGYWSVGLKRPSRDAFTGVPMSLASTLSSQRLRLRRLGLRIHELPQLRDVDTIEDARAVAGAAPASRFASALAATALPPSPPISAGALRAAIA